MKREFLSSVGGVDTPKLWTPTTTEEQAPETERSEKS